MVKKRNLSRRRCTKSRSPKRRVVRITSNPFLNFFLSVCNLEGNQVVQKIARNSAVEWHRMNYLDKTPYYLLADEAKKRKKRSFRKREAQTQKYSDWNGPMMVVPRKKPKNRISKVKSETDVEEGREKPAKIQQRRKSEAPKRKISVSSKGSESVLTSDVEGVDLILESSEKDLKRRKFLPDDGSESSFGLSTSVSGGTLEILPSDSSIDMEDQDKISQRRQHDFYQ